MSGLTFTEVRRIPASTSKVECCHFSADGKLLATGGHDKKVQADLISCRLIFFSPFVVLNYVTFFPLIGGLQCYLNLSF